MKGSKKGRNWEVERRREEEGRREIHIYVNE